jgi:hypothetical protein
MTSSQSCGYSRPVMKGLQHANAFVIQFRGGNETDTQRFSGRVEHVASGRTALFETVEELPQILLKMLRTVASEMKLGSDELA